MRSMTDLEAVHAEPAQLAQTDPCRCGAPGCVECQTRRSNAAAGADARPVVREQQLPPAWTGLLGPESAARQIMGGGGSMMSPHELARDLNQQFVGSAAKADVAKSEPETQPSADTSGQTAAATAAATQQRVQGVGTRRVWHNRIVEKLKDGKWHVVGHVAGTEAANRVKPLNPHDMDPHALIDLIRKILAHKYAMKEHKAGEGGKDSDAGASKRPEPRSGSAKEKGMEKSLIEQLMSRDLMGELKKSAEPSEDEKKNCGPKSMEKSDNPFADKEKKEDEEDEKVEKAVRLAWGIQGPLDRAKIRAFRKSMAGGSPIGEGPLMHLQNPPAGPSSGGQDPSMDFGGAREMDIGFGGVSLGGLSIVPQMEAPESGTKLIEFAEGSVKLPEGDTW